MNGFSPKNVVPLEQLETTLMDSTASRSPEQRPKMVPWLKFQGYVVELLLQPTVRLKETQKSFAVSLEVKRLGDGHQL